MKHLSVKYQKWNFKIFYKKTENKILIKKICFDKYNVIENE